MNMKLSLIASGVLLATNVQASTANYGWEDGATILGSFSASHIEHLNNADQARNGTFSLQVSDIDPIDNGTPQSFVGWVHGLSDGDSVTASFWVYDDSADRPAGRIWGHYTDNATDVDSYAGSAGGNSSYTDGSGWQKVSHSWTFDSEGGTRDGLVIEFRLYDSSSFTTGGVWLDDLEITSTGGTIVLPNGSEVTDNSGGDSGDNGSGGSDSGDNGGNEGNEELIITEYIEGSSNNKALELYNASTQSIDLSAGNYVLARYSNGGTSPSNITLSGTVSAGDVFVVAHSSSAQAILDVADQVTGSVSHNGDDAWELLKDGVVIDSFGQVGNDPGSQWGSGDAGTQNNTLRRAELTADTISTDAFDPAIQWTGHGQDNFSDLGSFGGSTGGGNNGGGDNGGGDTSTPLDCNADFTFIHQVQGSGSATPLSGSSVEVEAVVTADFQNSLDGFYLQSADIDADNDSSTSEGIFVYTGSSPVSITVGDRIRLAATAGEFNDMTQLSSVSSLTVCEAAAGLPSTSAFTLPLTNESDAESLEGMLVGIDNLMVNDVYNLARFGSVTLANGRRMIPTQVALPGNAANSVAAENALNQVVLDDGSNQQNPDVIPYPAPGLSAQNTLRIGDTVSVSQGVLHFSFGDFRIHPLSEVNTLATNPRAIAPELVNEGNLKIASFNVLNYFNTLNERGADTAEELQRQEDKIVAALGALDADVIGLMEIENDGYGVDSSIYDLTEALNQANPGADWQYITPEVTLIGTDAIAVGILYRSNVVTPTGAAKILDSSNSVLGEDGEPLFIDNKNRPTLAQAFVLNDNGEDFVLAVNHLKSKGSDCDSIGDPDTGDGQGNCNLTRTRAAQAVATWLNAEYVEQPVIVVGDLNAYAKEDPLMALKTAGYTELFEHLNVDGAYSYVFQGESGQLDHALANDLMLEKVVDITEWHINTDEPRALDYNTEFKSAAQIESLYAADAYRSSDHDPVVVAINLEVPFDPNLTEVLVVSVANLADRDLEGFANKKQNWEQKITGWSDKIAELESQIAELNPVTKTAKIEKLQARIVQLQSKAAIYTDLVSILALTTVSGNDTSIDVTRQSELTEKNQERLIRRQARFEQRVSDTRAAQLEARAAELMAEGLTERAERKLQKAKELRAKSAVYAKLAEVITASL